MVKPYCDDVIHCLDGIDAIKNIELYSSTLDLFFCDLELLDDDGFWQKTQGIGVLEYIKQKFPQVYTVVLSGLPTQAIKILIPERSFVNQHIRKKELASESGRQETMIPIMRAAKKYSQSLLKVLNGPNIKNLKDILAKYYTMKISVNKDDQKEYGSIHELVKHYVNYYKGIDLPSGIQWSTELYSTKSDDIVNAIWKRLPTILAIRKMIIHFVLKCNETIEVRGETAYKIDFVKFKDSSPLFRDFDKNFKTLMQTYLSFNVYKLDNTDGAENGYIFLKNLFEEELLFIDEIMDRSNSDPILKFESFKLFKGFMERVNSCLKTDYFDFNENISSFEDKIATLLNRIREDENGRNKLECFCFPYDWTSIPSSYKTFRKITSDYLALEDELDR